MRERILGILAVLVISLSVVRAENWPQWRGPSLNGVSNEKNLPVKWSAEENVVWKVPMPGLSGSTPIVWRDRIFLNVADGDNLALWCVDKNKGEVLWKQPLGGGNVKMRKHNMSSPSPVTDGTRGLRHNRHRHFQSVRLRRQRTLDQGHSKGVRQVWFELGLRVFAVAV